jgi:hypothetical protein
MQENVATFGHVRWLLYVLCKVLIYRNYAYIYSCLILVATKSTFLRSGDRITVGVRFSAPVQTESGVHASS